MTDKQQLSCLRCGAGMRFIGRDKFQRRPDLFLSDLTFALAGGMEVDIYSCPTCGKLEPPSDGPSSSSRTMPTVHQFLTFTIFIKKNGALCPHRQGKKLPRRPSASAHAKTGICRSRAAISALRELGAAASSVHAEANAIISASRRDMVGGTIYLVGRDARTGELLHDATSCAMCRRQIINAGLEKVVIRRTETEFEVVPVQQWIDEDDSLPEA